ncbi:MAG TPA: nuclear transport factor 2 family protein [Rubricoccaceae bacterium]|jgi:hypothetical protein
MRLVYALALTALLAGCASSSHSLAPDSSAVPVNETAAVSETTARFFLAMAARDSTALLGLLHPHAVLVAIGSDGVAHVESESIRAWVQSVARSVEPWRERFLEAPRVEVNGALATVWARYDFHDGDQFSHCGTDAFQLVRDGGSWRLLVVTFTIESEGCAPSPVP